MDWIFWISLASAIAIVAFAVSYVTWIPDLVRYRYLKQKKARIEYIRQHPGDPES